MQQALKEVTKIQAATFTVGKTVMQNNRMVVDATFHMAAILADPQGKAHTIDEIGKTRDTWTKIGGKWLMSRSEDLPGGHLTMDGKPLAAGAGGSFYFASCSVKGYSPCAC